MSIKLLSKAGTGYDLAALVKCSFFYTTRKNPMNTPNKLKLIKVGSGQGKRPYALV